MRWFAVATALLVGCAHGGPPGVAGDDDASVDTIGASCALASCNDNDLCTMDTCAGTSCAHTAISCDDNDVCTTDTCAPLTGCVHTHDTHGMMTFAYTGSIQTFAVPMCVTSIHVIAAGAQGGGAETTVGGMGATLEGDFVVAPADSLSILVGGQGIAYNANPPVSIYAQRGGTGGGGTFVVKGATILVIAGGGGGASARSGVGVGNGGPGQITTAGQTGDTSIAGGVNGGGGAVLSNPGGFQSGTGGGGYSGNGVGASNGDAASYGTPNQPGLAFLNGGAGGTAGSVGRAGAFGGGGAAGFTGGGGGGYSGGGGGTAAPSDHAGGGGGSINNGTTPVNVVGNHPGTGQVKITW